MKKKTAKNLILSILFWAIAFLTIWVIINRNKSLSIQLLIDNFKNMPIHWILLALISVILFIYFEGKGIQTICKCLNYPIKTRKAFSYASVDLYFSAITPSSTGGQPAALYVMKKEGVPTLIGTVAMLINIIMYTIASILIGFISIIICPNVFSNMNMIGKVFILIGFIFHIILIAFFILLLFSEKLLETILIKGTHILAKIHLLKEEEKKIEKVKEKMNEYRALVKQVKGKWKILGKMFLWNFLQKVAQISVILFVYLGLHGNIGNLTKIWTIQTLGLIGSFGIPVPGGIGVIDYIMLNGLEQIMPITAATNLELLGRGFSFYICILICGIITLVKFFKLKRSSKK